MNDIELTNDFSLTLQANLNAPPGYPGSGGAAPNTNVVCFFRMSQILST